MLSLAGHEYPITCSKLAPLVATLLITTLLAISAMLSLIGAAHNSHFFGAGCVIYV